MAPFVLGRAAFQSGDVRLGPGRIIFGVAETESLGCQKQSVMRRLLCPQAGKRNSRPPRMSQLDDPLVRSTAFT